MKHVTVIASDRTGLIAELSGILAARGINIAGITAQKAGGDAVIHLEVDRYDDTVLALQEENFHVAAEEAVLVRIVDQPGALATLSRRLADHQIDIRSVTMVQRHQGYSVVAIIAGDTQSTRELLVDILV